MLKKKKKIDKKITKGRKIFNNKKRLGSKKIGYNIFLEGVNGLYKLYESY